MKKSQFLMVAILVTMLFCTLFVPRQGLTDGAKRIRRDPLSRTETQVTEMHYGRIVEEPHIRPLYDEGKAITPIADVGLWERVSPGPGEGTLPFMRVGYDDRPGYAGCTPEATDCHGQKMRALLRFDLSTIPTGPDLRMVRLSLHCIESYDWPGVTQTITVCHPTGNWDENSVWTSTIGLDRDYDYVNREVGEELWHAYQTDVTDLVRAYLANGLSTADFLLIGPEPEDDGQVFDGAWRTFASREHSAAYAPLLIINEGPSTPVPTIMPEVTCIARLPLVHRQYVIPGSTPTPAASANQFP